MLLAEDKTSFSVINRKQPSRSYLLLKRVLDFSLAALALLLLSPLLLGIACIVKLTSPGPALFRQERIGVQRRYRGKHLEWSVQPFVMYKFRSMYYGASEALHREYMKAYLKNDTSQMTALNREGKLFKLEADPRVTPVGAFLRKTSLDQLPQLLNVLKGEMSLVGPRPALGYEVDDYEEWQLQRLGATPGITGYWQVVGRSAVAFDRVVELDVWYTEHQSLWLDLKILLMTPISVLRGKGAA